MKNLSTLLCCLSVYLVHAQPDYWQQEVHYRINANLNTGNNSISASLQLRYINHSPDTLTYIWFHLWPNAYAHDATPMARQLKKEFSYSFNKMNLRPGYIDSLDFHVNHEPVSLAFKDKNREMVKLILRTPLLPGNEIVIETPFRVQLPNYYSRLGAEDGRFMVCQWYPKPAVYDRSGWHPMPYLTYGEFYSEFGNFEVSLTVPSDFVVAATGQLQTTEELEKYRSLGQLNRQLKKGFHIYKENTADSGSTKTLSYRAENVHDFAWFADRYFIIRYDTLRTVSGRLIDIFSFSDGRIYRTLWGTSTDFIKSAVEFYSNLLGEYPYPVVQAVEGPPNYYMDGMEYPMVTLIKTGSWANQETLDGVIAHEVGHNWFYGILGSNERDHPWLDEGLNTYYALRYQISRYRNVDLVPDINKTLITAGSNEDAVDRFYDIFPPVSSRYPINTAADKFANTQQYFSVVYYKTATWLQMIKSKLGWTRFDSAMRFYFHQWRFRHPGPADFQKALEASSGISLEEFFSMLNQNNDLTR